MTKKWCITLFLAETFGKTFINVASHVCLITHPVYCDYCCRPYSSLKKNEQFIMFLWYFLIIFFIILFIVLQFCVTGTSVLAASFHMPWMFLINVVNKKAHISHVTRCRYWIRIAGMFISISLQDSYFSSPTFPKPPSSAPDCCKIKNPILFCSEAFFLCLLREAGDTDIDFPPMYPSLRKHDLELDWFNGIRRNNLSI